MSKYFLLLALSACSASAQNAPDILTNETVVKMVQAGVPSATIIKTIAAADKVDFHFGPYDLQMLEYAHVPDDVFKAMAAKNKGRALPGQATSSPVQASLPKQPRIAAESPKQQTSAQAQVVTESRNQKYDVTIIDRQNNQTGYSYVVPGRSNSVSNTNVNCNGSVANVNCSGSTNTSGFVAPPRRISYDVTGATLSLQLSDGRIAVVNCESKYALKMDYINRRSCRIPLVNEIQAEFDGNRAKLMWSVSIDGKKVETETYKILAILDK